MDGAWPAVGPHPNPWTRAEGVPVPDWAFGLRQNLDSLVDGGVVNPAGRKKWGSTAGAASEGVHTVRTGICLLEGGAMAYFYGASVSAEMLGKAMLAFHCQYGMHLDMNSGHSGFEFYNIKDTEGKDFKASRMIKNMWHMNYPRYIKRDARDYMFLTHRVLPSERLDTLTGLTWRAPALEGAKATTPPGQPSRILIADVTLDGGASHAELIRLPRAGASGQRRAFDGDTPPTEATTVLTANLDPIEAPTHHLALTAETFAAQLDAESDASLPALTLAKATETLTTTHAVVLAIGKDDILATHARREDLSELGRWFKKKGFEIVHALPCADQSGLALRLVSAKGEEAFRGGPLRSDRPIWTLEIAPAAPFSDRLESHITGPEF